MALAELVSTPPAVKPVANNVRPVSLAQVESEHLAESESTLLRAQIPARRALPVNSAPIQPAPPKLTVPRELTQLLERHAVSLVQRDPNVREVF